MEDRSEYQPITLPHSREAEEAVIGAILIDPMVMDEISLRSADFYIQRLGIIWKAAQDVRASGHAVDTLTICNRLAAVEKLGEIGGPAYITVLLNACPSSYEAPTYARIITDDAIRRRGLQACNESAKLFFDRSKDAESSLGEAENKLRSIETGGASHFASAKQGVKLAYETTERASRGEIVSVPTGFTDIDCILTLQGEDLLIVAGRPGSGKSAWLLTVADNVTKAGLSVLYFSLEMSAKSLHMRLNSMYSGLPVDLQRKGLRSEEQWEKYNQAVEIIANKRLYICDQGAISVRDVRKVYRSLPARPDLVIVDYIQLMSADSRSENRTQEVGKISAALKAFGQDVNTPLIAAAQMSRAVEARADKEPQLSDLRESGSLEQDASAVAFISREAQESRETKFKVAKNRNGETGFCKLVFVGEKTRFESQVRL